MQNIQPGAETYYYGQGAVYLAERNEDGSAGPLYWIGDVSALSAAISVTSFDHQESYSGQRNAVRRINIGKTATINSTWHQLNGENLAIALYGSSAVIPAGTVTGEALPANIKAGDRYSLRYQQVSNLVLGVMVDGTDYTLDAAFGVVTFLKDQTVSTTAAYSYAESVNTSVFTDTPKEMYLRFHGINLAENDAHILVEFYRVKFDPIQALDLINNGNNLAGLQTTASALFDGTRSSDPRLGQVGRVVHIGAASA
jgi:hypothetical protein